MASKNEQVAQEITDRLIPSSAWQPPTFPLAATIQAILDKRYPPVAGEKVIADLRWWVPILEAASEDGLAAMIGTCADALEALERKLEQARRLLEQAAQDANHWAEGYPEDHLVFDEELIHAALAALTLEKEPANA